MWSSYASLHFGERIWRVCCESCPPGCQLWCKIWGPLMNMRDLLWINTMTSASSLLATITWMRFEAKFCIEAWGKAPRISDLTSIQPFVACAQRWLLKYNLSPFASTANIKSVNDDHLSFLPSSLSVKENLRQLTVLSPLYYLSFTWQRHSVDVENSCLAVHLGAFLADYNSRSLPVPSPLPHPPSEPVQHSSVC